MRNLRAALVLSCALSTPLLATASAQAANVVANDASVRPQFGSSFSIGTLRAGEVFQVVSVRSDGWVYGYAKGETGKCGWVRAEALNSLGATQEAHPCGAPQNVPLDSDDTALPQPYRVRFVYCDSVTRFGNFGGAQALRSPRDVLPKGTPVRWYYTTTNDYAASISGGDETPLFVQAACLGPIDTPPPATAAPAPAPPATGGTTAPDEPPPGSGTATPPSMSPAPPVATGDTSAPTLAGATVSRKRFRGGTSLKVQVSEPGRLLVRVHRSRKGKGVYKRTVAAAGEVRVRIKGRGLPRGAHKVTVVAVDAAGNRSAPVTMRVTRR